MSSRAANSPVSEFETELKSAVIRFLSPKPIPMTPRDVDLLALGRAVRLDSGLAATAWGEGPVVLLAHGWDSRRTHWTSFVPALTEAGFTALAIDAPAHGESPGEISHMPLYSRKIRETGLQFGKLHAVIGHSFGAGASAMALARGLEASRGVFIAGPTSITDLMARWCRARGISDVAIPRFIELVAEAVEESAEFFDLTTEAARIEVPGLIVHDRNDDDIPLVDAENLAAAWRNSRLHVTERYGHKRILIARPVVQEVMRFLKEDLT
jgi:pimeloyl-ACP methyl ester carboxylesterase